MKQQAQIGVIGLGVMGANLARNFANNKIKTVVFNRTNEKTTAFIKEYGNTNLQGAATLGNFVQTLAKPRKIILMVQAGQAVDEMIDKLTPLLQKEDIIIDCGNCHYKDTERRFTELQKKQIHFVGCGISGGEEGALKGPSLMPGGNKEDWKQLQPLLEKIAAKDFNGKPCVSYIGERGAGHYVKMVHNGIEYGVMQLMAETYDILKTVYKLSPPQISKIFAKLNKGKLNSYLFEIGFKVLQQPDPYQKGFLIDYIADVAAQKGTGAWTSHDALDNIVPLPTLTEAVFARCLSTLKTTRVQLQKNYPRPKNAPKIPLPTFLKMLEDGLYAAMLSSYAQGYDLIQQAALTNKWDINLAEVSRIWQGGCIIRAKILHFLTAAYKTYNKKTIPHLFAITEVQKTLKKNAPALQKLVAYATTQGVPVSGLATALYYFQSMTSAQSPANFIQGLRDYFGAHTYERLDRKGTFHTDWNS